MLFDFFTGYHANAFVVIDSGYVGAPSDLPACLDDGSNYFTCTHTLYSSTCPPPTSVAIATTCDIAGGTTALQAISKLSLMQNTVRENQGICVWRNSGKTALTTTGVLFRITTVCTSQDTVDGYVYK